MLPEPLTTIADNVDQDLEQVYAEWCLEVEHPDLVAFVEHLLTWRLITPEQGQTVLDTAFPDAAAAGMPESVFSDAEPSEGDVDDPPTVKDQTPRATVRRGRMFEDPTSASIDVEGVYQEDGEVEEFDLFDEADMATVHDTAWPGRPVESDEVAFIDVTSDEVEGTGPAAVDVAGDWADADAEADAAAVAPLPQPEPDAGGDATASPARSRLAPTGELNSAFDGETVSARSISAAATVPTPTPPSLGERIEGPEPLSPFTAPPDDDEPIGDLETVIKRTPPVDLGDLETLVRKKKDDEPDLRSMVTVVPPTQTPDFDADTVQPAPRLGESPVPPEAWGSTEGEADDTDTVTQAPPELAADLIEGILEEDEAAAEIDVDEGDGAEPNPLPPSLQETRVPAPRDEEKSHGETLPAMAVHLRDEASKALGPVLERLRAEPRLRIAAAVAAGLLLIGGGGAVWQINTSLAVRAEQSRQAFVRAVTTGAVQAASLESSLVAGLGPLDATASLVTEALENGPRWRPVVGRPPKAFRSENTLPEQGFPIDRSADKTQGPRWIDPLTPAVVTPEVEQQNPRWGAVSEVFQRNLPPMINDRGAVGSVWVGLEDGFFITLPGRGIEGDLDPRHDPIYRSARTAASSVDWKANAFGRLTVARPVVSPGDSTLLGVVAVEFDEDWIIDRLLPRALTGVEAVGGVLLDDGAMIVGATAFEEAKAVNPTVWESMVATDAQRSPGYRIISDSEGMPRLYVYHRLTAMGWTHVIYGPLERLTRDSEPVVPGVGTPSE